ncbi:hypothetical protein [Bradyrhizobium sp. AUGA SZCCT0176]|uniref:hypothetical protein n=1 Tax=Bradyrhizobium sp. AUGA SZCCT0176 TaxID=2807664 RepID=UPI0020113819|nr:hypothetical protein [Bradyrhizobium sp. AUGA SZCCT0176]
MDDMAEETTDGTTFSMAFTIDCPLGDALSSGEIGQALNAPCLCEIEPSSSMRAESVATV